MKLLIILIKLENAILQLYGLFAKLKTLSGEAKRNGSVAGGFI